MTELKPCPFCGSEATLNHHDTNCDYVHHLFYPIVACNNCGCQTTEDFNRVDDKLAIEEWNTRQSVINWQPIEELTEDVINRNYQILLFGEKYYSLAYVTNAKELFCCEINEVDYSLLSIKKFFSYFAELTPPKQ